MDERYVPSEASVRFIAFVRACNIEENANAEIHFKLADKFFSKSKNIVVESFRGSAKSSIMEWFILYAAVQGKIENFGEVNFIAFVGDSAEGGVKNFFRNLAAKIERSDFLKKYLTVKRKTDNEMELVNVVGHQLNLKGYGAATNIRGVRYNGTRPEVVVVDDITTNEAAGSEAIQQTINDNFFKGIIPSLHPTKSKVIVIGTPISEKDLLHQLMDNPKWMVHKFPICEKIPCNKEDFRGNWEDRFPYEAVMDKYEMYKAAGHLQSFYQEYMLEVRDLSTLLVDEDDIKWYDPSMIKKSTRVYNYYITTDFATSTKKSADYSVVSVWAVNNNNDWMLVDGQCKRQSMQENLEDLFKFVKKWKPLAVGVESSGQQGGFLSILQDMMMKRNVYFTLAKKRGSKEPGIRPTKDKVHRFVTGVQPKFKQGKVWLPKPEMVKMMNYDFYELLEEAQRELGSFTLAGGVKSLQHDDFIDTMNQLSEIDLFVPSVDDEDSDVPEAVMNSRGVWIDMDEDSRGYDSGNSVVF